MKVKRSITWVALGVVVAAAFIVCLPLFRSGFFVTDDGGWMIVRLSAFYQSLREGQFPVRFLGRLNDGYGYPVANFLYPGFMYVGSLIHFVGIPFVETVKIILGSSVVVGSVFTYLWLRRYFTVAASIVGTMGFVSAPYLLFDVYRRGSVGEVLAIAVAAIGLYAVAGRYRWLFSIAVATLILSHNSLALLYLGFYVFYITVSGSWSRLWLAFGLGIGMASFFWAPALYERKYVIFDSIAVANPFEYFITVHSVWLVGVPGFIGAIVSLVAGKKLRKEKFLMLCMMGITLFMVIPISSFIWKSEVLSHIMQFPYRFLSLALFIGAWLIAFAVSYSRRIVAVILFVIVIGFGIRSVYTAHAGVSTVKEPEGYYTTNEATTTVANEYMPRWIAVLPTDHVAKRLEFYGGQGSFTQKNVNSQLVDVVVHAAEPSVVQVNTLYYPGWGASLDGQKVIIEYKNPMGIMRIPVPAGDHRLIVSFRETVSRFVADVVSLLSGIAFFVFLFV